MYPKSLTFGFYFLNLRLSLYESSNCCLKLTFSSYLPKLPIIVRKTLFVDAFYMRSKFIAFCNSQRNPWLPPHFTSLTPYLPTNTKILRIFDLGWPEAVVLFEYNLSPGGWLPFCRSCSLSMVRLVWTWGITSGIPFVQHPGYHHPRIIPCLFIILRKLLCSPCQCSPMVEVGAGGKGRVTDRLRESWASGSQDDGGVAMLKAPDIFFFWILLSSSFCFTFFIQYVRRKGTFLSYSVQGILKMNPSIFMFPRLYVRRLVTFCWCLLLLKEIKPSWARKHIL